MSVTPIPPPPAWDGCLWPIDPSCATPAWEAADENMRLRAQRLMTAAMRMLTAYNVGGCPVTVRPTGANNCCGHPGINSAGAWVNNCGCEPIGCEVRLPEPVGAIVRVLVDGVEIPEADYQVQNGNTLTWIGAGECPFPRTQDTRIPDTEVGTFSITYLNAWEVDANGALAGGVLALEFLKACEGDTRTCRLPSTVRSVSRTGMSFEIPAGSFPEGLTGIKEVDTYIQSVRPDGKMSYATAFYSPDRRLPRVVPTSVPL